MSKAYEGQEPYIFISYSHKDQDEVKQYIEALQSRGFRVWYDGGIEAGSEWPEYIANHLANCKCVMAFISSSFAESNNCRQELSFAQNRKKDVLSIYIDESELPFGLQMQLGLYQALHKINYQSIETFIESLCDAKLIQDCKEVLKKEVTLEAKVEVKQEPKAKVNPEPEVVVKSEPEMEVELEPQAEVEPVLEVAMKQESNAKYENEVAILIKEEELQKEENERFKKISNEILEFLNTKLCYVHKADIGNHLKKSLKDTSLTQFEVSQVIDKLVSEKKLIVQKMNTYAIFDLKERLEKQRAEQRLILETKLAQEDEKYTKKLDTLQKQLREQETIYEATKNSIFGAGARAKKNAKQSIEYYRIQIQTLKTNYMSKKLSLQNELQKI